MRPDLNEGRARKSKQAGIWLFARQHNLSQNCKQLLLLGLDRYLFGSGYCPFHYSIHYLYHYSNRPRYHYPNLHCLKANLLLFHHPIPRRHWANHYFPGGYLYRGSLLAQWFREAHFHQREMNWPTFRQH